MTKFKGTPRESVDLFVVPLISARSDHQVGLAMLGDGISKSVEINLDGGSRTVLADVATDEIDTLALRSDTTGATLTSGASGMGGGFGTAGSMMAAPSTSTGSAVPLVTAPTEMRMPGVSAGTGDIRATYKLNPDRKTYSVTVNPVFSGKGDIAMPKVPLLPGGEGN